MDHIEAAKQFEALVKGKVDDGDYTIEPTGWDERAEYRYRLHMKGRYHAGPYTMGWGCFDKIEGHHRQAGISDRQMKDYFYGRMNITVHDFNYVKRAKELTAKKHPPSVYTVLEALFRDAQGCDQPFEDWAPELGYSDDSISAKAIWEACNNIRRFLESVFTHDEMERGYELVNEM